MPWTQLPGACLRGEIPALQSDGKTHTHPSAPERQSTESKVIPSPLGLRLVIPELLPLSRFQNEDIRPGLYHHCILEAHNMSVSSSHTWENGEFASF
jgi:hypothetical protein